MAWYSTGTVYLTNGSTALYGTATDFIVGAKAGYAVMLPDDRLYEIAAIVSATEITLQRAYLGTTISAPGSADNYRIIPFQGLTSVLVDNIQTLINDFDAVRTTVDSGHYPAGTVSAPSISTASDTDTGIYWAGANILGLAAGGLAGANITATAINLMYAGGLRISTDLNGVTVAGRVLATRSAAAPSMLNRTTSDGVMEEFQRDGVVRGQVNTAGTNVAIGTGDTGLLFDATEDSVVPWNMSTNTTRDAAIDIGEDTRRFRNAYLSGGVYLGGVVSGNYLDDYEEQGTFTVTTNTDATGAMTESGEYTKIGNVVPFRIVIDVSTNFTSNTLNGLPFPAAMGDITIASMHVLNVVTDVAPTEPVFATLTDGATTITFTEGGLLTPHNPNTTQNRYIISGFYYTNS